MAKKIVKERSWRTFRESGMLWCANRILHMFGWAIVCEVDEEDHRKVMRVYPARVRFRGFVQELETRGFKRVTRFMKDNVDNLLDEALE